MIPFLSGPCYISHSNGLSAHKCNVIYHCQCVPLPVQRNDKMILFSFNPLSKQCSVAQIQWSFVFNVNRRKGLMDYSHRHSHSYSTVVSGVSLSQAVLQICQQKNVFPRRISKESLSSDIPLTCAAYFLK